jgi:hypothetical protein
LLGVLLDGISGRTCRIRGGGSKVALYSRAGKKSRR